ncbi:MULTISPECIES: hypothetical protein [Arthrobacter]|uniref:Uncharacterized protein n=1 Tax=Arthrobacter terricola TaxID=2547396 RepID=A0A4R5K1V8_9MICC|nr:MULTISPECIES: hypothetical protein [Arthrobacter]MBT8163847.1 hypothetical protein [Arthrobacter sp. GN70]TDF85352.1 hypothetical protein E1809_25910 [Arthrobacter terricola]
MAQETLRWIARFIPLFLVVIGGLLLFVLAKRRKPTSIPPGRWFRLLDKDGNEIKGPIRTVTAIFLVVGSIVVLASVILPFTAL